MDASIQFPELYLKGDDFAEREVTLTIRAIQMDTLYNPSANTEDPKIVLYFVEAKAKAEREGRPKAEKRIVLSKTLYVDFVNLTGSKETKDWEKKRFTFYRGKAIKGGKMVIRAKLAVANAPTEPTSTSTSETKEPNANG